jgi:uncharacterized protein YndB with AHSA1/START domain
MSVKKEASGRRSIQVEVEVPGTPEEVWQAIATGPGVTAWFVPTEIENDAGGKPVKVISRFGPRMDAIAEVKVWEPPHRFAAESPGPAPNAPSMATEWIVEARDGGKCLVRVVHSLFASTDDWDNQLDGLEQGWPAYFRILRRYLETFKGMACSAMQFVGFSSDPEAKAWEKMGGELGLLKVAKGQKWSAPDGFPRMAGVVDSLGRGMHSNTLLLGLDTPVPGSAYIGAFSCGGMVMMCMSVYLYGAKAKAAVERDEPTWQTWMAERFPMPQMG